MDYFDYKGAALYCEEIPITELVHQFDTPLYIYSHATLERHFRVFNEALSNLPHLICFSAKSNGNIAILRAIAQMGGGADIVSGGELFRCLEAGVSPQKIVFSGVGKTVPEIEYGLRRKVLMLNVESESELWKIALVAEKLGTVAPISFRLNPDVDAKTHPYIATGLKRNKFGLTRETIFSLYKEAAQNPHLAPLGLTIHIGSQITETTPFVDAVRIACDIAKELQKKKIPLKYLDIGGGLGVRYRDEEPPSPKEYAKAIAPLFKGLSLTLILEPGRVLIGNAGVLITRVVYVKKTKRKQFIVVDAGMNDLIRPALYKSEHTIEPVVRRGKPAVRADIVGPICESADTFAQDREIEDVEEGDLLCIRTAGAYGFSMASQYNARPRPAEVMVRGSDAAVIRARESFDDLIRGEKIPDWLNPER
ncbi:MAG TPA: diaminopimelate decarboxylase [Bdellovibrionota bacterium]|nr:diaminopimelate decarboxylase [Bdellovibrionota bacterium]